MATVPRDELARMLKEQHLTNMEDTEKMIRKTVDMLRLLHSTTLHCTALHCTACNGCLTAGKLCNVIGSGT